MSSHAAAQAPVSATDPQVLGRVRSLLEKAGWDAVVAMSQDNATYLLGVGVPSHRLIRERRVAVLLGLDGPLGVVAVTVEQSFLQASVPDAELRPYDEHSQTAMQVLAELMRERGLQRATVGVELDFIAAADFEELKERLPEVRFRDASALFKQARLVKTPGEIARIRRGAAAAERAIVEGLRAVGPGSTERDLARAIADSFYRLGGDEVRLLVVGSGERSSHPNAPPTDRRLKAGDVVRIDVLGSHAGYYTDCARTAVVGSPSEEDRRIWAAIVSIHREVLAHIRPGVRTRELYELYSQRAAEHGLQPLRFLGHGLGLGLHEGPFIDAYTDVVLEPGMVFAIEPVHFVAHRVGYHLEDEVLVTAGGCEVFTAGADASQLWRVGGMSD